MKHKHIINCEAVFEAGIWGASLSGGYDVSEKTYIHIVEQSPSLEWLIHKLVTKLSRRTNYRNYLKVYAIDEDNNITVIQRRITTV
jgi:hypothetical protein